MTGTSYAEYENMVLAVVRSRGRTQDIIDAVPVTDFDTAMLAMSGNTTIGGVGDLFGEFTLTATPSVESGDEPESLYRFVRPQFK